MHPKSLHNSSFLRRYIPFAAILLIIGGCAYYNTMFNALDKYDSALTRLNASTNTEMPQDIRKDFEITIDKCWKLINIYGEDSNYADDALLLIAKSNFHLQEFTKAERFARQMIQKYPESDLYAEGNLWLAKSLVKLDRGDDAIGFLNTIIDSDADDDLKSRAWFSLGELYYQRDQASQAIEQFRTCIEYAEDELLVSEAGFLIGKIYYENRDYEEAADELALLFDYDEPIGVIFESQMLRIKTLLKLDDPDECLFVLNLMGRETRFFQYQDRIQAKIGECLVYDGEIEEAIDQYDYTIRNHPRTPGSAIAAFGLAEIFEHTYADYDSARKLYLRVKQEDRNSDLNIQAGEKAYTLEQYLKLKENIRLDLQDLNPDSLGEEERMDETTLEDQMPVVAGQDTNQNQVAPASQAARITKPTRKKREPEEIRQSLIKNNFALAEFFLLTMQNYDSAEVAYKRFINTFEDTSLVPKSYYALYYLYDFELNEEEKADSIKNIILEDYGETSYARHILLQDKNEIQLDSAQTDTVKNHYLRAEQLMYAEDYADAIPIFKEIAREDSGTVWAERSSYAIAWIYEKKLEDIDSALAAYEKVAEEYPNSAYGAIAKKKIQPPPPEPETEETPPDSIITTVDSLNALVAPEDSTRSDVEPGAVEILEKIELERPVNKEPDLAPEDTAQVIE